MHFHVSFLDSSSHQRAKSGKVLCQAKPVLEKVLGNGLGQKNPPTCRRVRGALQPQFFPWLLGVPMDPNGAPWVPEWLPVRPRRFPWGPDVPMEAHVPPWDPHGTPWAPEALLKAPSGFHSVRKCPFPRNSYEFPWDPHVAQWRRHGLPSGPGGLPWDS